MSKPHVSLNDTANVNLEGYEALLAAMISVSLYDLFEEPPIIKKNKVRFKWLRSVYYPQKDIIELRKKEANLFFDSPKSLFNKYCNISKEYLIKHYADKRKAKEI